VGRPLNPLRSVGARLSLALAAVLLAALALVYLIVVPSLRHNLIQSKVSQLAHEFPVVRKNLPSLAGSDIVLQRYFEAVHADSGARVAILAPLGNGNTLLSPVGDTPGFQADELVNDSMAVRAAGARKTVRGTVEHQEKQFAEVAERLDDEGHVLLLSAPLHDSLGNVRLVQRRLLAAGLLALLISLVVGFGAASVFGRRIRRLERAADRIAGGDFEQPVVDHGQDELGELARAFERMRHRLAQLDDARRAFIANASHELRTPLFSLGGFLELFRDEDLDDATRQEFLNTMSEQVERLQKLATDLLDLSRLDAGRLRVEREPFELGSVASALVNEFRAVALAADHPLELVVEQDPVVVTDPERTLQIGRALVENALRHTPAGTPVRVVVTARGARAQLLVEDEGPTGIPPAQAEHVFERFRRLDGSRASGSGLGLAIARELAQLMDGELRLESRPGRTVFTFSLAAAEPTGVSRETPVAATAG
jgi:signal transduction histidine kinase